MSLAILLSTLAFATEVKIEAVDGQKAVVLVDSLVKGETPVVTDVDPGEVTLSFRDSMFGPVLFTHKVEVPASGSVTYVVNVEERSVEGTGAAKVNTTPAPSVAPGAALTQVEISSKTKGLQILLDGQDVGKKTPATLSVDPGRHVINLADGCAEGEEEFTATEGKTSKVEVQVRPGKVMLEITTTPEGATIQLDGESIGTTPLNAKVSCGERTVVAVLKGYKPAEKKVDLADQDLSLSFDLEKDAYGSLEVSVEPEGVIKLDGDRIGANTATLGKVSVGMHELTIERSGIEVEKRSIEIKENSTVILTLVVAEPDKNAAKPKPKPVEPKPVVANPKPAKVKKPKAGGGPSALRVVANTGVTAVAVPAVILGSYNFGQAVKALKQAENEPDQQISDAILRTEVRPREVIAYTEWGIGGAFLLTGATLWITSFTDASNVVVIPTGRGLQLIGRF